MSMSKQKLAIAAAARLKQLRLAVDFDARVPDSKPTDEQQEALDYICGYKIKNAVVTGGNRSGKSQMMRRLVAWFLREDPEAPWKRRPEWKGPLIGVLIAKSHKIFEGSLLEAIIPFFEGDDDFKIIRNGHYIEALHYKRTGNTIWLLVHENVTQCRERVQSFAAHMAFLDEMPSGIHAMRLLEEIAARVTDKMGVFASFFTPKSVNKPIRDWVEGLAPPVGKKFALSFLKNPGIDEAAKKLRVAELQGLPEHLRATVLSGSWATSESTVFNVTDDMIDHPPEYNNLDWRHVVSVDPALNSQMGVVVAAECPRSGRWYIVFAKKLSKIQDSDHAVELVYELMQQHRWNVCQIVYDPASTYWFKSARKHDGMRRYKITSPFNKNSSERWEEMVSNLQLAMGTSLFIDPWRGEDLLDELYSYEWSDTTPGKVKKGQKYHLLDATRYLVDCLPKFAGARAPAIRDARQAHAQMIRSNQQEWARRARGGETGDGGWRGRGVVGRGRVKIS